MATDTRTRAICIVRSERLTDVVLHSNATNWHRRGGPTVRNALAAPDEDTITLRVYCRHPDAIECMSTIGVFTPSCKLDYEIETDSTQSALDRVQLFFDYLKTPETSDLIDYWSVIYRFGEGGGPSRSSGEYDLQLAWNKQVTKIGSGRELVVRISNESRLAANGVQSRDFFAFAVSSLGLSDKIDTQLSNGKLTFNAKLPWRVQPHPSDFPSQDPYLRIFPFDSVASLESAGRRFATASKETVTKLTLVLDAEMEDYKHLVATLPREYEGWELYVFGHPSEATQAWLAGDVSARPRGRIPLGRGWEGDPNEGFSYSVSVVEAPDGPCIELGSDRATTGQLKALGKYFEGLEFHPV